MEDIIANCPGVVTGGYVYPTSVSISRPFPARSLLQTSYWTTATLNDG